MIENKKILITGAAGFIATNLAKFLSEKNEVISLDKKESKFGKPLIKDITDPSWIDEVGEVDYVFHLAATVGVDYVATHPFETMNTEIFGINSIVQHARKYKPKKVIFTSTSAVYGDVNLTKNTSENASVNPISTYGTAKVLAEIYLKEMRKQYGVDFAIVRIFNAYGPYQEKKMVIPLFIKKALNGEPLTVFGDGRQTRDFTYISDIVNVLVMLALSSKSDGETFNVGTGIETNLAVLAETIKTECSSSSELILQEAPKEREKFEIRARVCNPKKIMEKFEIREWTTLTEGLRKTIAFIKNQTN